MSESINICLSCGLCCDGTLIGFVELDHKELPGLRELMDIEESNGSGFFLQACDNYCEGCNIYHKRPKQCATFKCELLNSVDQEELVFDSAIEVIDLVKQKKISIEKKSFELQLHLQSPSFYFRMIELKKQLKKYKLESALSLMHVELISDLEQLDDLLLKNFGLSLN
ncbi:MAG: hypothetical protein HKN68_13130 [Saprospiraceae bacterium]|nr:hypothetical protein [Saprospiraceae bacterium]